MKISFKSYLRILFIVYILLTRIHVFNFNLHFLDSALVIALFAFLSTIDFVYSLIHLKKFPRFLFKKEVILPLLFILSYTVSTVINTKNFPLSSITISFVLFILFYSFYDIDTSYDIEKEKNIIYHILSYTISICSLITIIFAIMEKSFNITFFNYTSFFQDTRLLGVAGFFMNPNQVAITAFVGLVSTLLLGSKIKTHKIIFVISNILVILFSDSRAAILSLLSLVIVLVFYFIKKLQINMKVMAVLALVFTLSFGTFIYLRSKTSPYRRLDLYLNDSNSNESQLELLLDSLSNKRYSVYKEVISLANESPIYGRGLYTLEKNSIATFKEKSVVAIYAKDQPHNVFISAYYYSGIIGLIISILLVGNIFIKSINLLKLELNFKNYCLVGFLLGTFIFSSFDTNFLFQIQFFPYIFWLFAGYVELENLSITK